MDVHFALIFWSLVALLIFALLYTGSFRRSPNATDGTLTTDSGRQYSYSIGDNIYAYTAYGNFHGLDVRLPMQMPHIYLDSLRAGGHHVNTIFDASQSIALEGDFYEYYNVFVPRKYEAVALSILSPDVMETLQKYASDFDIEIYGDHLRVIGNRPVRNKPQAEDTLIDVAGFLLQEIEDRQPSWSHNNSLQSIDQDLKIYPFRGIRVFDRYASWNRLWLTIYWSACLFGIFAVGLLLLYEKRFVGGSLLILLELLVFAILQFYTTISEKSVRFWSRRG